MRKIKSILANFKQNFTKIQILLVTLHGVVKNPMWHYCHFNNSLTSNIVSLTVKIMRHNGSNRTLRPALCIYFELCWLP
jgi:hypothetical protein